MELDATRRELLGQAETLKAKRNEESNLIGQAKKTQQDASEAIAAVREINQQIKELDERIAENDEEFFMTSSRACQTSRMKECQSV